MENYEEVNFHRILVDLNVVAAMERELERTLKTPIGLRNFTEELQCYNSAIVNQSVFQRKSQQRSAD